MILALGFVAARCISEPLSYRTRFSDEGLLLGGSVWPDVVILLPWTSGGYALNWSRSTRRPTARRTTEPRVLMPTFVAGVQWLPYDKRRRIEPIGKLHMSPVGHVCQSETAGPVSYGTRPESLSSS